MRFLVPVALLATSFSLADDAPRKGGGLFGFGSQPREQLSSALFPEQTPSLPSSEGPRSGEAIFRGGAPAKVEPVSYVIENGRRIQRPIEPAPAATPAPPVAAEPVEVAEPETQGKKRGGFLGFGKKEEPGPAVPPVVPNFTAAPVSPAPAPVQASRTETPRSEVAETVQPVEKEKKRFFEKKHEEPAFEGESKRGGWIPFVGGRKKESDPIAATPIPAAEPLPQAKPVATSPAKPATASGTSAKPETPSFVITKDNSKPEDKPKKEHREGSEGGILTPLTKIKPPQKEIDLTGAETIIQDGQIVDDTPSGFSPAAAPAPSAPRQAPQVVDGVKTYSSWDDVNARSQSAADKILNRIR